MKYPGGLNVTLFTCASVCTGIVCGSSSPLVRVRRAASGEYICRFEFEKRTVTKCPAISIAVGGGEPSVAIHPSSRPRTSPPCPCAATPLSLSPGCSVGPRLRSNWGYFYSTNTTTIAYTTRLHNTIMTNLQGNRVWNRKITNGDGRD